MLPHPSRELAYFSGVQCVTWFLVPWTQRLWTSAHIVAELEDSARHQCRQLACLWSQSSSSASVCCIHSSLSIACTSALILEFRCFPGWTDRYLSFWKEKPSTATIHGRLPAIQPPPKKTSSRSWKRARKTMAPWTSLSPPWNRTTFLIPKSNLPTLKLTGLELKRIITWLSPNSRSQHLCLGFHNYKTPIPLHHSYYF